MIRVIFFTLLCLVFLIEIKAFLVFIDTVGLFFGLLEVIVTFIVGLRLITSRPVVAIRQLQQELVSGGDLRKTLFGGLRFFMAGLVLIVPGLFSDMIGMWLWLTGVTRDQSFLSKKSNWTSDSTSTGSQSRDFDTVWQDDELSRRAKGKIGSVNVNADDVVDATIISIDDADEIKKD